ncbi:EamA-like transporter family protein [Pseudovibrio axinellae]|uniref:EamA-like transporter family protein n=1 Tax=Pseudovibrio axinellae TaxID=989403 RepID=A0A165T621_9HYPH|nr:DMT family transporter [Pseudovibrio axinellae]KZL05487.1 EamA-like transporter family protein [Pseudovibrio axinellae]SEP97168.1 EamA domain-containing membrane protein RarD [Pseudovibrio axinellae]
MRTRVEQVAALCVAISGLMWGVFWIPLRELSHDGITGIWAVVLFYVAPTVLLLPLFIWRWRAFTVDAWSLHRAGLFAGISLVLYSGALVYTSVVQALLLYYLTPLWSTLLARMVLGEPITKVRWGTMIFGLMGLLVILKVDLGLDLSINAGTLMGFASGIIWACAAVCMRSDKKGDSVDFTLSYFFWGSIAALALTFLPLEGSTTLPDWQSVENVLPWFLPVALFLVVPPAFAVMWGATLISPGLLGILFMTEISAGVATAALWAGEPFGTREVIGITLISMAGLMEPVLMFVKKGAPS